MARGAGSDGNSILSILALEVLLYFNWWFSLLYICANIVIFAYKGKSSSLVVTEMPRNSTIFKIFFMHMFIYDLQYDTALPNGIFCPSMCVCDSRTLRLWASFAMPSDYTAVERVFVHTSFAYNLLKEPN